MTAPTYVPDGEACPRHGQPTTLLHIAGAGYFSQCPACRDDFLAWFASHIRHIEVAPRPAPGTVIPENPQALHTGRRGSHQLRQASLFDVPT